MLRTPSLAGARAFERMLTTPLPPHARTPRPQVDSFWQAQAVLMLTPRMPLYIPCVYNAFLYWSNVAAAHAFAGRDADARAAADAAASAAARSPREHTGEFEDLDAVAKQLAFEFDAWDDDELRDAYEGWFVSWTLGLAPAPRCAFLLLTFGAAVGPPLARTTFLLPSAGHCATFLPEAAQIMLPAASSADEFAQRMDASIVLGAAPPPSNLSSEM